MSRPQSLNTKPEQRIDLDELRSRPKVAEWLRKVGRGGTGSEITQGLYIRRLRRFIEWAYKKNIITSDAAGREEEELLLIGDKMLSDNPKKTMAEKITEYYFDWLEKERKLARTASVSGYTTLRSFFRSHGIVFTEKCPEVWCEKISRPPLKEDLRRVFDAAPLEEKLMIGLARDLGWRREDIVALTYGDIRQDYEAGQEYLFIQKTTEKEKIVASNFIGKEVTALLREKLEQRKKTEKFTDDTPLLREDRKPEPISLVEYSRRIKQAGEKVGVYLTAKLLRKWFRTQATNAGVPRDRVCQMGGWAIPGVGRHYDLPTREELLPQFKAAEPYLMFEKASVISADEVSLEAIRRVAKAIMPEEIFERLEIRYKNPQLSIADKIKVTEEEIERWKQQSKSDGGITWSYLGSPEELKAVGKVLKRIMSLSD